jgi:hypothetical protein
VSEAGATTSEAKVLRDNDDAGAPAEIPELQQEIRVCANIDAFVNFEVCCQEPLWRENRDRAKIRGLAFAIKSEKIN